MTIDYTKQIAIGSCWFMCYLYDINNNEIGYIMMLDNSDNWN